MHKIKYLVSILLSLLIFNNKFAAEYDVPPKPASVDMGEIDLDGDLDIVVGHKTGCGMIIQLFIF